MCLPIAVLSWENVTLWGRDGLLVCGWNVWLCLQTYFTFNFPLEYKIQLNSLIFSDKGQLALQSNPKSMNVKVSSHHDRKTEESSTSEHLRISQDKRNKAGFYDKFYLAFSSAVMTEKFQRCYMIWAHALENWLSLVIFFGVGLLSLRKGHVAFGRVPFSEHVSSFV